MPVSSLFNLLSTRDSSASLGAQYAKDQDTILRGDLTTLLDAESASRTSADTLLTTNLATETAQRQASDSTLTQGLTTEIATRLADDDTLQVNITAEASSRTAQDANIQSQVTVNTNKLGVLLDSTSAMDEISEIVAAYSAADSSLQASLTALVNLRPLTTYVDAADNVLTSSIVVEKGRVDALVAGTTVDTFLEVKGVTDAQDGRLTALESTSATQSSLATQTGRIDAIVAGTTVDTFAEVKTVTDGLSSSITTNASSISTNAGGISSNLSTNTSQTGLIAANASSISGNTSSIEANDADILAIQNKTSAVTTSEISSLAGIGSSTVASQLAAKSSLAASETFTGNKTVKVTAQLAFRVRSAANADLFTCDTSDMEVQTPALTISSSGINLLSGKTLKFDDTLLALSNLSDDPTSAIALNSAKVTYNAQSAVSANTSKRTYPQSEEDKVTANS